MVTVSHIFTYFFTHSVDVRVLQPCTMVYICVAADNTVRTCLTEHHFLSAFEKFIPSTLHNVPILKPGELTWSDVGGLHDVRAVLEQTLLWPTKVRQQFGCLYLHMQICLYGY